MGGSIKQELEGFEDGQIILVETNEERALEINMASLKVMSNKCSGVVVSASRPYKNLIELYKKNKINTENIIIIDCISKGSGEKESGGNVVYMANASTLTSISLGIFTSLEKIKGKKFVFLDSISSMLIHNKPDIFARFIHSLLTRMRIKNYSGIFLSLENTPKEVRAEIASLCDKVIKV